MGIFDIFKSTDEDDNKSNSNRELDRFQEMIDKKDVLMNYCKKNDIDLKNVAYVGNDINDKEAMEIVGYSFCPGDAHGSIKKISNHILDTKGGNGVIRELLDFINNKKGG